MGVGLGLYPFGLFALGAGQLATAAFSPSAPLPDPATGLSQTGRQINPVTGDYVVLADGRLSGMSTVQQLVLLAIERIDFSDLQEKGPNFRRVIADRVEKALAPLIRNKQVQIRQVVVTEPNQDAGLALLDWVDLTTGFVKQTQVG